jgi:hypothetical protein
MRADAIIRAHSVSKNERATNAEWPLLGAVLSDSSVSHHLTSGKNKRGWLGREGKGIGGAQNINLFIKPE